MGGSGRDTPFYFQKPACAAVDTTVVREVPMSRGGERYDFEAEIVLAVGNGSGTAIRNLESTEDAAGLIRAIGVGSDMTMRDRQDNFKSLRQPWCCSKALEFSAPVSRLVTNPGGSERDAWWWSDDAELTLTYDGEVRQRTPVKNMIWSPLEQIVNLSKTHDLYDGDLIFTGTPAGVGPVKPGGHVRVVLENTATNDEIVCEFIVTKEDV